MDFLDKNFRQTQYDNLEVMGKAVCAASPSVTYDVMDIFGSQDPFSGKSNKYAESKVIAVAATGVIFIKFGASDVTDATTSDYPITSGKTYYFVIDQNNPYMRIIDNGTLPSAWVTEIY